MFENLIIEYYASAFFRAVFFGFAAAGAEADEADFDAVLFNLAFAAFLLLEIPKEPLKIFPFFDFLSPRPINFWNVYVAIIAKSVFFTKRRLKN